MQQDKGNKYLSDISQFCHKDNIFLQTYAGLLAEFDLRYINSLLLKSKTKGVDSRKIFQIIFVLPFFDLKNISQFFSSKKSQSIEFKKDVFYDFMRNPKINWRNIMLLFVRQALSIIDKKGTKEDPLKKTPSFFILDDSILEKSGKRMEFLGKVYDHCSHTYTLGWKLLALGLWDGKSFIPVNFSLHNEPGKNKKRGMKKSVLENQFSKERDQGTPGYQRSLEVGVSKLKMSISLINNALKKSIKADYVLADSWFICEDFIKGILQLDKGLHIIGLMKTNRKINYNQKTYMANMIPEIFRKKIVQCRKLKCSYIPLTITYKGIEMKAYWVKMNGQNQWKLLITTDKKLSFIQSMKYYQIRWSIEVFFKDCKQKLGINANQSIDFDSIIAHISIVMMNYTMLSLKKRFANYETFGELFRHTKEIVLEQNMVEKIWEIIIELYINIFSELGTDMEQFLLKIIELRETIEAVMKNALMIVSTMNQRTHGCF